MDVRIPRRGVPTGVLWGALGVMAWAAITVVTGGGAAHADESGDGPLSPVTSLVDDTLSTASAPLAPVVTEVVAPVVQTVVTPVQPAAPAVVAPVTDAVSVVAPATAPVVEATVTSVEAVVIPITQVLDSAPVAQVTAPVVDAVIELPIVGDALVQLGLIDVVGTVIDVVDDTAAVIGDVADETVTPIVDAVQPADDVVVPPPVDVDPDTPGDVVGQPLFAIAVIGSASSETADALHTQHPIVCIDRAPGVSSAVATVVGAAVRDAVRDSAPATGFVPAPAAPASSSAGSSGASSSTNARLDGVGLPPLPSWWRLSGASDDDLPSSAVADTDVSPD